MTTTLRSIILFSTLLFYTIATAQIERVTSIPSKGIIGMQNVEHGVVILSKSNVKHTLNVQYLDTLGRVVWTRGIPLPKVRGYDKNHCSVVGDAQAVYVIFSIKDQCTITSLSTSGGDILRKPHTIQYANQDAHWTVNNGKLYTALPQKNQVLLSEVSAKGLLQPIEAANIHQRYNNVNLRPIASNANALISSSYTLTPNHGSLHLYLESFEHLTSKRKSVAIDLVLEHTSFTYNNTVDQRVFGVHQGKNHFYLVGKLDQRFKNKYPTTKLGDAFIGLWIAKFNYQMELVYLSEIPFQYFKGYIPANVIRKPAVIAVKEDHNNNLFVNINELKSVIYGKTYIAYLDSMGMQRNMQGGMDVYNTMEYDITGLRNAGKSHKIRLMNDKWSPYTSMFFNLIDQRKSDYSSVALNTIDLSNKAKISSDEKKSYTYILYSNHALYFEYTEYKKGVLNVYSAPY